jgi:hypothetical protein
MNNELLQFLPGFFQGISRVFISYPFDYLRLKIQTNQEPNIKNAFKNNYKQSFRGLLFPLVFVPVDRAISFYIYEKIKKEYNSPFLASIVPSIFSNFYMTPINLINTNYIYHNNTNLKKILSSNINSKIYSGLNIEILRNTLSSYIFLHSYNYYNSNFNNPFLNGVLSSLTMWTLTYPLDTIKANKFIFKDKRYIDIIKMNTIRNLYKGIGLVYLRSFPSAGTGMLIYEYTKKKVNEYHL